MAGITYTPSQIAKPKRPSKSGPDNFPGVMPSFLVDLDPKIYLSENYCVADFETTNKNKGTALDKTNRIVLATWLEQAKNNAIRETVHLRKAGELSGNIQAKFGDEYHQGELVEAVNSSVFLVAHHSKFELQWLHRCGVDLGSILVWDTLLGEYVLAGNRKWDLSLEGTAKRYGLSDGKVKLVSNLIASGVCPSSIPEQWLLEYGSQDTLLCHQIFLKQRERIVNEGLLPVMFTRCLLTPVLADMELRGVQLDAERVKEEYERTRAEHHSAEEQLARFAGGINWRSSKQVAEYIYGSLGFSELHRGRKPDRTDSGKPRTDAPSIERLRAQNSYQREFQEAFRRFKKSQKRLENLEKLKTCVEVDDGLLYFQFNQAVTGTHRLSSSGLKYKIQGQNIDHTLKRLFRARNGRSLGEADGVQLEWRVAAHLGNDPIALADIRTPGFDIHWQTAESYFNKPRNELDKDTHRYESKPRTFRPLYGAITGDAGEKRYIKFFQSKYSKIYEVQTGWTYEVLENKKLRTCTGLTFYWPDCELEETKDGRGYFRFRTSIFNYPVQSLATADIIPIAIVFLWHRLRGMETFLVNTVHDSVIAEIAKGEESVFKDLARRCFTVDCCHYLDRVYGIDFISPIGVATKIGGFWGEGKEEQYDYDPVAKAA